MEAEPRMEWKVLFGVEDMTSGFLGYGSMSSNCDMIDARGVER